MLHEFNEKKYSDVNRECTFVAYRGFENNVIRVLVNVIFTKPSTRVSSQQLWWKYAKSFKRLFNYLN